MSDDFMLRSIKRRQQELLAEMRQMQIDAEHWNSLHPDEEPIVIEPITRAEIDALKKMETEGRNV